MGSDHSSMRELFNKLDKNHQGSLKLSEVVTVVAPGFNHKIHNSPVLLYRFDEAHEGSLRYEEFVKLLNHLRATEKRLKKRRKNHHTPKVWCSVNRETVNEEFCLDRDAETVAFTGRAQMDSSSSDSDSDDKTLEHDFDEELRHDAQQYFDENILGEKGKKSFITWLFKMADANQTDTLSEKELVPLLQALRQDGIAPEGLVFDAEKCGHDDTRLAREIIREYDTGRLGYLTRREFEILGDLIVKNYELRSQYDGNEVGDFILKRRLGKGAAGEVRLAVHKLTHEKKAIKIIPKGDVSDCSKLDTEIKAMLMLQNPHVVQLEQVLESDDHVFFVMELCGGGNLHEYLDSQPISEDLARFYFHQIIDGISYCHSKGVAHRDLSLANLLLDNDANIKISDFGCAGIFVRGWDVFATPMVGGLQHIAPEQILGTAYSGEKMDMWSAGIILYTLLVGRIPFRSTQPQQFLDDVKNVRYTIPDTVSSEAADLIQKLLVFDPNKRYTCKQILEHPWMQRSSSIGKHPLLRTFLVPIDYEALFSGTLTGMQRRDVVTKALKSIGIYTLPSIELDCKSAEEKCQIRCQFPDKDIKFTLCLKRSIKADQFVLEFTLREGESREFLSLMPKIKNVLQKLQRKTTRTTTSPSLSRSSPSDSLSSDDELEIVDWSNNLDEHKEKSERSHKDKTKDKHKSRDEKHHRTSHKDRERDHHKENHKDKERDKDREKEKDKDKEKENHKDREKERDKDRDKDKDKDKDRDRDRDKKSVDKRKSKKKPRED